MAIPGKRKGGGMPPLENQNQQFPQQGYDNQQQGGYYGGQQQPVQQQQYNQPPQFNNQQFQPPQQPAYQPSQQQSQKAYYEETEHRALDSLKTKKPDRIDHKNKKIIPTGGAKAKVKDRSLDNRKNTLVFLKFIRFTLLLIIFGIFGLGIKNTFFPAQIYTNEDIDNIVKQSMGDTGFPTARGRAYAQEYLNAYLNSTQSASSIDLLKRLKNNVDPSASNESVDTGKTITNATSFQQRPFSQPSLISEKIYTLNSAVYEFSVFVTDASGQIVGSDGQLTGTWLSFQVSVTFDEKTNSLSIVEPPTLIPNYSIYPVRGTYNGRKPGTGETEDQKVRSAMSSTIIGFLNAYAQSSFNSHSALDQYIPHDKPIDLVSGFNNTVKLDPQTVTYEVYKTDKENEWRVDLRTGWTDIQNGSSESVTYMSHYLMTIQKTSDNIYIVSKFVPYPNIKTEIQEAVTNEK